MRISDWSSDVCSSDLPVPEVMIPLAATDKEISILKAIIDRVAGEVQAATGIAVEYMVGTMIELPRAALQAGRIARVAEFFSFGTNDLTQTTFGLSRSEEHTSELQSLMRISYAVFCLKKKKHTKHEPY